MGDFLNENLWERCHFAPSENVLLAGSTASFAQSSDVEAWKGLRLSYDHSFLSNSEDYWPESYNGFSIGYEHAFKVAKKAPLFIQTGASLNLSFAKYDFNEWDEYVEAESRDEYKQTLMGLTISVNFVYGVRVNDNLAIKLYTGFYVRVNLMGKEKNEWNEFNNYVGTYPYGYYEEEVEKETYNLFDNGEDDMYGEAWKRVQAGWQIGVTFDIKKFNIGVEYGLDFNRIANSYEWIGNYDGYEVEKDNKLSHVSVRLGYNF